MKGAGRGDEKIEKVATIDDHPSTVDEEQGGRTKDDEDKGNQHKNGRARQFDSQEPARQSSRHENQK
jgi:hypothetical protein